ncbi:hypothetical protein ACHAWF_000301, partial [Thalassiosira exigua]
MNRSNLCFSLRCEKTGRPRHVHHPQRNVSTPLDLTRTSRSCSDLAEQDRPAYITDTLFSCGSSDTAATRACGDRQAKASGRGAREGQRH